MTSYNKNTKVALCHVCLRRFYIKAEDLEKKSKFIDCHPADGGCGNEFFANKNNTRFAFNDEM